MLLFLLNCIKKIPKFENKVLSLKFAVSKICFSTVGVGSFYNLQFILYL